MLVQLDLDGGTRRELKQITQVDADGSTIRNLKQLWQNDAGGVPRLVFSALSAAVVPETISGSTNRRVTASFAIGTANAVLTGGSAPFTYAWTADNGFSVTPPGAPSPTVLSPVLGPGDSADGQLYVTVTDGAGSVAVSPAINLFASNYGFE